MTPILFNGTDTIFSTNGLGRLSDTLSCKVTEERNGIYELEMTYPITGVLYNLIDVDKIIVVKHNGSRQAFDIYKITEPINGIITINAQHLSYRLSFIPVKPFEATGITDVINKFPQNCLENNPFTLSSDITNETSTYNQIYPKSFKACLGGSEGSLLDIFSGSGAGEYYWDNWNVTLYSHRGQERNTKLSYSLNITDFKQEQSLENIYTGAIAYWSNNAEDEDVDTVIYYGEPQYSSSVGLYPNKRTVLLDVSSRMSTPPSLAQLNEMALEYVNNNSIINENITVSFIDIRSIEEYKTIAPLLEVNLCDTIIVNYQPYNVNVRKKVIRTVWDALLERYDQIELGDNKSNFASTFTDNIGDITEIINNNSRLTSIVQRVDRDIAQVSSTVSTVEENINGITADINEIKQTSSSLDITISEIQATVEEGQTGLKNYDERIKNLENVTNKVETHFGFSTDGLTISSSNDSEYRTIFDNTGMVVKKMDGSLSGSNVLVANNTGVNAYDLTARNYLIIDTGTYKSRFQRYSDSYDAYQLGCFWIEHEEDTN